MVHWVSKAGALLEGKFVRIVVSLRDPGLANESSRCEPGDKGRQS